MPELPEVETVRRGLAPVMAGHRVVVVRWRGAKLRGGDARPIAELTGRTILRLRRHGKFILADLDDCGVLLLHLGMTGKLLVHRAEDPERPHTHLALALDTGTEVRFSDPRRFGAVRLHGPGDGLPELERYGPDALGRAFTLRHLRDGLSGSRAPLKAFLMDQSRLAGVGNIYASEALWRARLSPTRRADTVSAAHAKALHAAVRQVLRDAIGRGGTSFNDYVDSIGVPGHFGAELAVFQRQGKPCPRCTTPIRRIVQAGRSTFLCPKCQR